MHNNGSKNMQACVCCPVGRSRHIKFAAYGAAECASGRQASECRAGRDMNHPRSCWFLRRQQTKRARKFYQKRVIAPPRHLFTRYFSSRQRQNNVGFGLSIAAQRHKLICLSLFCGNAVACKRARQTRARTTSRFASRYMSPRERRYFAHRNEEVCR